MGERLPHFCRHDALLLLRHSFAIPKILYLLRTSPCFRSTKLVEFDLLLRSIVSKVINVNLSDDDVWCQASLPVSSGGIGIRSAVQLASSAFLASAAGCKVLSSKILPPRLHVSPSPEVEEAVLIWSAKSPASPPASPIKSQQKAWDKPVVMACYESLLEKAEDRTTKARLLGAATKESGAWLNVPPVSSLGLRMFDDSVTISVGLRLGVPLCRPHLCRQCGIPVDEFATHGLSCMKSQGRHPCHNALNEIIQRSLASAGVPSQREPHDLSRLDGKRPDGVSMIPWSCGRPLVWDATCSDTFAKAYKSIASSRAGAVADRAEMQKARMYSRLEASHLFAPVAVETSGAFGSETLCFLKQIASRLRLKTGDSLSFSYLIQRLSVAVQQGNALAVLGSLRSDTDLFDDFSCT